MNVAPSSRFQKVLADLKKDPPRYLPECAPFFPTGSRGIERIIGEHGYKRRRLARIGEGIEAGSQALSRATRTR
jgi:hypothetical protein